MLNSKARTLAFVGIFSAVMFVFLAIETFIFTAWIPNFTPAILTLPLAVALSFVKNKRYMFLGGTMIGCCSFILAICISNVVFINPLVSIAPRIAIGVVAYFVCLLLNVIFKKCNNFFVKNVLIYSISGIFGILTNTVLTISMMAVFNHASLAAVFATIMTFNFLGEVVGAAILTPIYVNLFRSTGIQLTFDKKENEQAEEVADSQESAQSEENSVENQETAQQETQSETTENN